MFDTLRGWFQRWFAPPAAQTATKPAPPMLNAASAPENRETRDPAELARPQLVAYDENLLERARTQWYFGDWDSLSQITRETLQHHPDRARLALLVAAAHLQLNQTESGRQFVRLAQDWGCSKQLIAQILISGVHNSLGRAAVANGEQQRALGHFENALVLGAPGSEVRLLVQARGQEQFRQLQASQSLAGNSPDPLAMPRGDLAQDAGHHPAGASAGETAVLAQTAHAAATPPATVPPLVATPATAAVAAATAPSAAPAPSGEENVAGTACGPAFDPQPCAQLPASLAADFFADDESRRTRVLQALTRLSNQQYADSVMPDICATHATHRGNTYYFAHFAGDYIPRVMTEARQFYESMFLNLLARLHEPGKIIIDGGANIGNHSVFFAGIMRASVVSFEPQPHNFLLLAANRVLNHLDAMIDIRQQAIGAAPGQVSLHMTMENNFGTFSARVPDHASHGDFSAPLTTLDLALAGAWSRISMIKLDLEGMELEALQGAHQILSLSRPVVAVECFTKALYGTIRDFLAKYDYFVIDSTNATPTFIFLNKGNPFHLQALARHLELLSIDKLKKNVLFNQD